MGRDAARAQVFHYVVYKQPMRFITNFLGNSVILQMRDAFYAVGGLAGPCNDGLVAPSSSAETDALIGSRRYSNISEPTRLFPS